MNTKLVYLEQFNVQILFSTKTLTFSILVPNLLLKRKKR